MSDDKKNIGLIGKLRKNLSRMLGRKDSESIDISLKSQSTAPITRKTFRVNTDNMHVICLTPKIKCRVQDISPSGIGFISTKEFPVGGTFKIILLWSEKTILKNLRVKVARRKKNLVGCEFIDLDEKKELLINKVVLAAQKKVIQRKKYAKNNKYPRTKGF